MPPSNDPQAREPGARAGQAQLELHSISAFDVDLLALLHGAGFGDAWDRPWSSQSFADILAMPGGFGLIAAAPGEAGTMEPVGFGLTLASGEEVELLLITVLPSWRRHGIARRLLLALLDHAARGGAGRAILEVATPNLAAIKLYEQLGFSSCGRRQNYYNPGIDALIYERILDAGNIKENI